MNQHVLSKIVEEVIQALEQGSNHQSKIPIGVSARHVHLNEHDLQALFGSDYSLTKKADLSQPGQFAANETITIAGPKGSIDRVRILGPSRQITQVEVSMTDAVKLGLNPPVRESGNIVDSSPITLIGPKGSIYKKEGLIIAQSHIHMNENDAFVFSVQDGDFVRISAEGKRPLTIEKVLIRVSSRYQLEMHIDTDEANAGFIKSGDYGILTKYGDSYK